MAEVSAAAAETGDIALDEMGKFLNKVCPKWIVVTPKFSITNFDSTHLKADTF